MAEHAQPTSLSISRFFSPMAKLWLIFSILGENTGTLFKNALDFLKAKLSSKFLKLYKRRTSLSKLRISFKGEPLLQNAKRP
jgi:hypothetical protein